MKQKKEGYKGKLLLVLLFLLVIIVLIFLINKGISPSRDCSISTYSMVASLERESIGSKEIALDTLLGYFSGSGHNQDVVRITRDLEGYSLEDIELRRISISSFNESSFNGSVEILEIDGWVFSKRGAERFAIGMDGFFYEKGRCI